MWSSQLDEYRKQAKRAYKKAKRSTIPIGSSYKPNNIITVTNDFAQRSDVFYAAKPLTFDDLLYQLFNTPEPQITMLYDTIQFLGKPLERYYCAENRQFVFGYENVSEFVGYSRVESLRSLLSINSRRNLIDKSIIASESLRSILSRKTSRKVLTTQTLVFVLRHRSHVLVRR